MDERCKLYHMHTTSLLAKNSQFKRLLIFGQFCVQMVSLDLMLDMIRYASQYRIGDECAVRFF